MAINVKLKIASLSNITFILVAVIQLTGCATTPKSTTNNTVQHAMIESSLPATEARKVVIQQAATQLGKPYKLSGNSPREGFDCSGLVFYSYLKVGKLLPRRAEEQFLSARKVQDIKPGDLVFFTTDSRGKHIDHVGIYMGEQQFIHAPGKGRGVTVANMTESYWQQRYKGAGNYLD